MPVIPAHRKSDRPAPLADKPPARSAAALTVEQKLAALRRVQLQAEQRVQLGAQLLKAAEAHTSQTQSYVEEMRQEQDGLRQKLEHDVAAALTKYEEWVGTIDDTLAQRMQDVESKLGELGAHWSQAEQKIERLAKRAEQMFDQSRMLLEATASKLERYAMIRPTGPASMPLLKASEPAPAIQQAEMISEDDILNQATENHPTQLYSKLMRKLYDNGEEAA